MTSIKTYDPAKVQLMVGGSPISGFAPGSFIELAAAQESFSDDFGVDGEPIRWANRNPFDTLTLLLAQSSTSNAILSNLLNADLATQVGILPVLIQDNNSQGGIADTIYVSARCWISGQPRISFAGDPTGRRWTLRMLSTFYNTMGMDSTPSVRL